MEQRLNVLMAQKVADFRQNSAIKALALTGSLARGMTWAASDLDFWGFLDGDEDDFDDDVTDGIYWEIDLKPLAWLDVPLDAAAWLTPPPLQGDNVTALEALWGCRVIYDQDGRLTRVAQAVQERMNNQAWLNQRADNYILYGYGCLDALDFAPPLFAIVWARQIATQYGVCAYWMRRGKLLSSVLRVPERLADHPPIQTLYRELWGLQGKSTWDTFLAGFTQLPEPIQATFGADIEREVQPAIQLGHYDGGVRHMLDMLVQDYPLEDLLPVLLLETDLAAQKERILLQVRHFLDLCRVVA